MLPPLLAAGGQRQLLVDVGSFTKINTVTTQTVNLNTGKTWTPKVIIFFTSGSTSASGTWEAGIRQILGFTAGASNSYSVGGLVSDNVATTDTSRYMNTKALTLPNSTGAAPFCEAALQSFNAGGFTLNWTTNGALSTVIGYIALGGDIQAEVLTWNTGTGTGNKTVSTGTIQPDLVLHMSSWINVSDPPAGAVHHYQSFGAMNSAGEQWFLATVSNDAVSPANTSRWQRIDSCLGYTDAGEVSRNRLTYVSMNANGFTVNQAAAPSNDFRVGSLCIKDVKSKLGSFTKSGAGAPVTQSITAPGFPPALTMLASDMDSANTSPNLHATTALGASDGTNHRVVAQVDRDGVNPTQADSLWRNDAAWVGVSLGPVEDSRGTIAHTATGFDLTLNPNNASATQIQYAVLAAKG